ncbi:MAG: hypothetical protein G8D89_18330 [gamma proteobacterium symbiont of Clathrolucina costata]
MTPYEIIDAICDAINPILFFTTVALLIRALLRKEYKKAMIGGGFLISGLLLVYGIMFLDNRMVVWESVGGDYSTHTAFAVAVLLSINLAIGKGKALLSILAIYILLMLYQQYHSLFDIVTTVIVVGLPLYFLQRMLSKIATNSSKVAIS